MRRLILHSGVGVCLVSFLCGAWMPPVLFQATTANLVAYWKFDETAGTVADDDRNLRDGTYSGPTPLAAPDDLPPGFGGVNNVACRLFSTANAHVDLGLDIPIILNRNTYTIAAWIRPTDAAANRDVISFSKGGVTAETNDSRAVLAIQTARTMSLGGRVLDADGAGTATSPGTAPLWTAGEWNHVAATVDTSARVVRLYLNGRLIHTSTAISAWTSGNISNTNVYNASIGANDMGTGAFFKGRMDDVRVYHSRLNDTDVLNLARPRAPSGLTAASGPESVVLTWTNNQPNAIAFNVYRKEASNTAAFNTNSLQDPAATAGVTLIASNVAGTTYTDFPPVPQGTEYTYMVRAVQPIAPGLMSLNSNAVTEAGGPPIPRTNDSSEGLFEDKCACGSSAPGPALPAALAGVAALALALRRRRSL